MKRLMVLVILLFPAALMGQVRASARAFPLTVHVVSSRMEPVSDQTSHSMRGADMMDLLGVTVRGKKYVLAVSIPGVIFRSWNPVLIEPGDYPARVTLDKTPNPGELRRTYELRLANGKTVKAYLWGIG